MSESRFVADVRNMHGLHTVVYDAAAVPDEVWRASQVVMLESMKAELPAEQWQRAEVIAGLDDFEAYRASRVNPQILVGDEWNSDQLHRRSLAAFTFEGSELVAGALTSLNTSATKEVKGVRVPERLWPVTYWTKMLIPPGVKLPTSLGREVSGKRRVHLREAYGLSGVRRPQGTDGPAGIEVSGITLAGLGHMFREYHPMQEVATYLKPNDPADAEFVRIARAIGAEDTGTQTKLQRGYEGDVVVRAGVSVEDARARIRELLGSHADEVSSSRLTSRETSRRKRRDQNRLEQEWQGEYDARHRGPDK